ncbi:MAG: NADPH-dependent assimilatory sulfite reductase hemoprotein subunit [Verrucomicrobia bacterium]|nr:NADPH-dependent assimilatory sulfite reductase hemoprotein subunit [Verrucomicrobiota bacterium]
MSESAPVESKPLTKNEQLKIAIPTLAGNIAATLANPEMDAFSSDDEQFLKFHGIYQQDDRDRRKQGKVHIMMIRGRIPGGVLSAKQWGVFDTLSTQYGNDTLRITTRQSIQFHGVAKSGLGALMRGLNQALVDTLAACGDVNRNVMAAPTPASSRAREQVYEDSRLVSEALLPKTKAYHAIWLDGVQLNLEAPENKDFVDPLYGRQYLPRKFKAAFVIPPVNDMDVLTNCLGFIAVIENGEVVGYNLAVGGGMGRSHGNTATYPRLASVLGFFPRSHLVAVSQAVLTVHRDFGDRTDRKHARLKYVVQERGADFVRAEVEKRAGIKLGPVRSYHFTTTGDTYGWAKSVDGSHYLTLYVSMGRIKDAPGYQLKTALRRISERFSGIEFRLTANQNVILANISESDRPSVQALLSEHGVPTENQAGVLHSAAIACPALPTCGLSLSESERYLPSLLTQIEGLCQEVGLKGEEIVIRMTGCPNGCARPYIAEIGFVGKAPGRYQIWLGADAAGTRLARAWKEMVKDTEILSVLRPVLTRYAAERTPGERFGDWVERSFWSTEVSA